VQNAPEFNVSWTGDKVNTNVVKPAKDNTASASMTNGEFSLSGKPETRMMSRLQIIIRRPI
jgi:hypothetical protein